MSRWILAALLVAATAALMTSLLREESAASAHAEVLPGEVQGPRTIEDALVDRAPVESDPGLSSAAVPPAATVVLDAAMTGASDSAIKSLEDRLYLLELEDRIALADRAMIDQCEPLWGPYWSSGQYEVVESITADFMKDEQGRPRPMQTRFEAGELRVVVLPQANHPEVWEAFENLVSMREERSALRLMIEAERGAPQGTGWFGR